MHCVKQFPTVRCNIRNYMFPKKFYHKNYHLKLKVKYCNTASCSKNKIPILKKVFILRLFFGKKKRGCGIFPVGIKC